MREQRTCDLGFEDSGAGLGCLIVFWIDLVPIGSLVVPF